MVRICMIKTPDLYKEAHCGLICQNKRQVITFIFITFPILAGLVCFCWKTYLLSIERAEMKESARNAKERLMQLETVTADFKGQSLREKLEENMQFKQNPLSVDKINEVGSGIFTQTRYHNCKRRSKD